ncbi:MULTISPECIES: ABC transporter ATP-binding protein [Anaerococcus]|uniref:ABC transporter ATP-binding protein n=1 Tax=Anaerococcus TaxID=165779 RepID=UPI0027BA710D|nr:MULTISPECIES: sn-glycerol-3-phosphate ABC transporter ATP-binding protein UgpC [Anaerococcus]MDU2557682.1 sn-glycerol-3-phosphate ABC transporter ATP-binding protein UgpC [Anaerococcus prevotii]MDU2585040.1 sn-glycerol-3-phosphate ABC transporter ATP-binding protein UgpC [Anaerococcus prevotii]
MAGLKFDHIYKIYDNKFTAVKDFNLEIKDEEFVVFVGPSGCGKSTTLRMVAGLEEISKGELYIGDKLVNNVEPKDRDIAMVFQNYALYPQMTVKENMSYALRIAKVPKDAIDKKVKAAAEVLGLENYLDRKPQALSGGQRQRVALGRAIVRDPQVFLMDEPLSNLDAKLRVQTRAEISKLHEQLDTTFIYVTHDQTEAMTMADRIVIMQDGIIKQVDTPINVYSKPENLFVATFIGSPQMNLINGKVIVEEDNYYMVNDKIKFHISKNKGDQLKSKGFLNKDLVLGIRPEHIYGDFRKTESSIVGLVTFIELLGAQQYAYLDVGGEKINAVLSMDENLSKGQEVKLYLDEEKMHFFDKDSQENILL